MAINVSYQNGKEYSPDMDVALNKTIIGENIIVGNTSFLVSQNTTANMGVKVSAGKAWINGYFINSTASVSLSITGNTSGYSRIDAVVVEASANVGAVKVIQGTPASNPTCPAIGNTQIKIAEITVVNNAISIGEANIKDCRAKIIESLAKEVLDAKENLNNIVEVVNAEASVQTLGSYPYSPTTLQAIPNRIYRLEGYDRAEVKGMDLSQMKNGDKIYFSLETDQGSIVLKKVGGNFWLPTDSLTLSRDIIYTMMYVNGVMRIMAY